MRTKKTDVYTEDEIWVRQIVRGLRNLRLALGISTNEMAKRLGISRSALWEMETRSADTKLSTLRRYARALEGEAEVQIKFPKVKKAS